MSEIFAILGEQLKAEDYVNEVFTFIDAIHLISKTSLSEGCTFGINKEK